PARAPPPSQPAGAPWRGPGAPSAPPCGRAPRPAAAAPGDPGPARPGPACDAPPLRPLPSPQRARGKRASPLLLEMAHDRLHPRALPERHGAEAAAPEVSRVALAEMEARVLHHDLPEMLAMLLQPRPRRLYRPPLAVKQYRLLRQGRPARVPRISRRVVPLAPLFPQLRRHRPEQRLRFLDRPERQRLRLRL